MRVFVFCFLLCTASYGQLLKNGSFEDPADKKKPKNGQAASWGRWGAYMNREDGWEGPRGGKCMIAYHHWEIADNESSGLYQDVERADPNVNYTFSVYSYLDEDTNADYIELRIENLWGNGAITSQTFYVGSLEIGKWQRLSVEGIPADKGLRTVIVVFPAKDKARKGCVKFDDAKLAR